MENITWLGHASFYFVDEHGNRIYYVDPFDLKATKLEKADIIFITHAHADHFSPDDIAKIIKEDTIIIAPADILAKIDINEQRKVPVKPNEKYNLKGFEFATIPAYNNHPDKLHFHPKLNAWVGYIFYLNGKKIYHAGDTDFIPEMKLLKELQLDIAMLPIGGMYTMGYEEASEAANAICAKITIPMHYKNLNPNNYKEIEEDFKQLVLNSKVEIVEELT